MLFYRVGNHPCISEACGDSVISIGPIARDMDQPGNAGGWNLGCPIFWSRLVKVSIANYLNHRHGIPNGLLRFSAY